MNYDELPRFERFSKRRITRPSSKKRREHAPNCMHKHAYYTASIAQRACQRQLAAGAPYLRVYRCQDCPYWHLTHKKPI
jgi:hypothetical protein